jgi:hypothetical protein
MPSARREPFVRWSYVKHDDALTVGTDTEDAFHEISIVVNYYLGPEGSARSKAKVTFDINWLPNGSPAKISSLGYLGDSGGQDEVVVRGQFQLKS